MAIASASVNICLLIFTYSSLLPSFCDKTKLSLERKCRHLKGDLESVKLYLKRTNMDQRIVLAGGQTTWPRGKSSCLPRGCKKLPRLRYSPTKKVKKSTESEFN